VRFAGPVKASDWIETADHIFKAGQNGPCAPTLLIILFRSACE